MQTSHTELRTENLSAIDEDRAMITESVVGVTAIFPEFISQKYGDYTSEDHAVWQLLYDRRMAALETTATVRGRGSTGSTVYFVIARATPHAFTTASPMRPIVSSAS